MTMDGVTNGPSLGWSLILSNLPLQAGNSLSEGNASRPASPQIQLLGSRFAAEHLLQESRYRNLVFAVGTLFGDVLRVREGVLGSAEELQLEVDLGGPQLLDQGTDFGERSNRIF